MRGPRNHGLPSAIVGRNLGRVELENALAMPTDLPDGRPHLPIRMFCPAPFAKIFLFIRIPNQVYIFRRPAPLRGARAIVTNAGRDAMDADGADDRRTRRTGEVVWS
jgi:hypothetical protein